MLKNIISIINLILISAFISCEISTTPGIQNKELQITTNLPPTGITLVSSADTVSFWENLNLTCLVEDPENDPLTYEWTSYKITESSTLDNYEFDYWLNHGRFIETGMDAVWEPGKLEGKYLILCNAQDKAGYEISAGKIVEVRSGNCLTALTDKITYQNSDFDSLYGRFNHYHLNMNVTIWNRLDIMVKLYGCVTIGPGIERNINGQWIICSKPKGCAGCRADMICPEFDPVTVLPGEVYQDDFPPWTLAVDWQSIESGFYRLFIPFLTGPYLGGALTDTLYSNEFEIIK